MALWPTCRKMMRPLHCIFPARCNLTSAACERLLSNCGPEQSRPSNDEAWHANSCGGQKLLVVGGNDRDCLRKGRCGQVLVRRDALVFDLDLVNMCDDVLNRVQSHREHAGGGGADASSQTCNIWAARKARHVPASRLHRYT